MKHWGPNFAIRLDFWIDYRRPLVARLRDPVIEKTQVELDYLATRYADRVKRLPGGRHRMVERRKHLRVAATFIELHIHQKMPKKNARADTAKRHGLGVRAVYYSLEFAKSLHDPDGGPWTWWAIAERMARKGKITQLRRMY